MALEARDPQDPSKFLNMMDCIHIDEKFLPAEGEISPSAGGEEPKAVRKKQIAYHKGYVSVCSCASSF